MPNKVGKPPINITEEMIQNLCDAVEIGATYEIACRSAGFSYSSLRVYILTAQGVLKRQETETTYKPTKQEKQYLELLERLEAAKSTLAIENLQTIYSAAKSDPIWAEKLLRYRYPQEYGGAGGGSVGVSVRSSGGGASGEGETIVRVEFSTNDVQVFNSDVRDESDARDSDSASTSAP